MLELAMLLAMQTGPVPVAGLPACRPAQLKLSTDGRDGDFGGMSHSGTELLIRNVGQDCVLPALPTVRLLDARGRDLSASRQAPVGMHPGPVMLPVRLPGGKRATADLRWVSGPAWAHSRNVRVSRVFIGLAGGSVRASLAAVIYGDAVGPVTFEQTPLRVQEGMASD